MIDFGSLTKEDLDKIVAGEINKISLAGKKAIWEQVGAGGVPSAQRVGGGQFAFSNPQMTGSLVSPYFNKRSPRKKYMNRYPLPQNYLA